MSKFSYWLAGWLIYLRHPIKKPIDVARSYELGERTIR